MKCVLCALCLFSVNDVLATGEDSFYFTNMASQRHPILNALELILLLPFGNVVYYDGDVYQSVVDGLTSPNGMAMSLDGGWVTE
jgi:sugar lactone lactonase YvrE